MLQFFVTKLQHLKWSIRYKIGLAFTLVLALFVINGAISILLLLSIRNIEERQQANIISVERLQRLQLAFSSEVDSYSDAIFVSSVLKFRDRFKSLITREFTDVYSENSFESKFVKLYFEAFDHFSHLEEAINKNDLKLAIQLWQPAFPVFDQITKLLDERKQELKTVREASEIELKTAVWLSITLILAFTLVSLILAVLLLLILERALVQPLRKLEHRLHDLSEGNLSKELEIVNRDEIGRLGSSFTQAVTALREVLEGVQIGDSLQTVSQQLLSASEQQFAGTKQQVEALTQVTTAMEELGSTAELITTETRQVRELTDVTLQQIERVAIVGQQSQTQAKQMTLTVEQALKGMERIGQQVHEFSQMIHGLNQQAETIGGVVGLLGSIADEVHLLSLNAAIESAGGGEQGERFRAVAREIKLLANRANKSTKEVRGMIKEVQFSSKAALVQVELGQTEVQEVVASNSGLRYNLHELETCSEQLSAAVRQLQTFANQVSARTEGIRQATQQQQISNAQVIGSVRSVGLIAEENTFVTRQVVTSSTELQALTVQLNAVLSRVKLPTAIIA